MGEENAGEENAGDWLALMIGNSHLHWAWFEQSALKQSWDTPHLTAETIDCLIQHKFDFNQCHPLVKSSIDRPASCAAASSIPLSPVFRSSVPLWIASVVPAQTQLWQEYGGAHLLRLDQVPLQGLYPTMGIDRALALWGAASTLGLPVLAIDAGTALTFTGADATGQLVGGAILPGLGLQIHSLSQHTAALPLLTDRLNRLRGSPAPSRWAFNTPDAMVSGVLYTLLAGMNDFIQSWLQDYPGSPIVITGGDSDLLCRHWQHQYPQHSQQLQAEPDLVFWGMRSVVARLRM